MSMIKIYSTPNCHYCKLAKEYFTSKGVKYEDINVISNPQAQQEMIQKSGQLGVPVIDMDGRIVVGFDRARIDKNLSELSMKMAA